jgi:hypothetical protein
MLGEEDALKSGNEIPFRASLPKRRAISQPRYEQGRGILRVYRAPDSCRPPATHKSAAQFGHLGRSIEAFGAMAWVMPQMGHDSLKEFWKNKQGQVISSDVPHDDADQLHSIIELSRAQTIDASTAHIETVLSSALSEPKCCKAKALAGHRHRGDGGAK